MIPVAQDDVTDRLRRSLTTEEVNFLPGAIDEASALVEGYLGVTFDDDDAAVPPAVIVVTSRVVARLLTLPEGATALADSRTSGMGPFSATIQYATDSSSGGPWLTKSDRMTLAPYRARGAISIPLVRESGNPPSYWGS